MCIKDKIFTVNFNVQDPANFQHIYPNDEAQNSLQLKIISSIQLLQ